MCRLRLKSVSAPLGVITLSLGSFDVEPPGSQLEHAGKRRVSQDTSGYDHWNGAFERGLISLKFKKMNSSRGG